MSPTPIGLLAFVLAFFSLVADVGGGSLIADPVVRSWTFEICNREHPECMTRGDEKICHDEDGLQNHGSLFDTEMRHLCHAIYGFERKKVRKKTDVATLWPKGSARLH